MLELLLIGGGLIGFGVHKAARQEKADREYIDKVVRHFRYNEDSRNLLKDPEMARRFKSETLASIKRNPKTNDYDHEMMTKVFEELEALVKSDLDREKLGA